MYGRAFQYSLIFLLVLTGVLFSLFFLREIFPEYRTYQNAYVALEEMRARENHTEPSPFQYGIKQIVLTKPNGAPEVIDRCTSCHVALDVEAYSPTRLARDLNGTIMRDADGVPLKVPNENYIFTQLERQIALAKDDPKRLAQLQALSHVELEGRKVEMSKVLMMHPLMGREERPFQFHSPEEIGCTSCHNGNGRALTTDKAHGPVFDGTYEPAFEGVDQHFLEHDSVNDPSFSKVFNHKPGHVLLFQTTPLFVDGLMEANCMQCHLGSNQLLQQERTQVLSRELDVDEKRLQAALESDEKALHALAFLQNQIAEQGLTSTLQLLTTLANNPEIPKGERAAYREQKKWLEQAVVNVSSDKQQEIAEQQIEKALLFLLGTKEAVDAAKALFADSLKNAGDPSQLREKLSQIGAQGQLQLHHQGLTKIKQRSSGMHQTDEKVKPLSEVDRLTPVYRLGEEEYFWQACYACHKIAGLARGGVGPELTQEGLVYPWFIKLKLRWPQGAFPDSRMPNMHLDHRELEALTTFLLAQKGNRPVLSDIDQQREIKAWEEGKKQPWEEELPISSIRKVDQGMTIFATEGCAACHRLVGFTSSVGLSLEKEPNATWKERQAQREWFQSIIPELIGASDIPGSVIVERLHQHQQEIDSHIIQHAKEPGVLDQLDQKYPELLTSFYSNFAYALRAHDHEENKESKDAWKARVRRVLMLYIQEYGLGRLIGPRLNWSGIYRSDEWLMEHFYDPSSQVPRSLMPSFRFDATKFSALTYMLGELGRKNLANNRLRWKEEGFQPQVAYELYCSQCHGPSERRDEAPLLQWIYPIPKNLRNGTFLQNLTRPRMIESIVHGVKGTPMPPWGETPQDKAFTNDQPVLQQNEVEQLVDWLLHLLPARSLEQHTVPKWDYTPEDVLRDLEKEKDRLKATAEESSDDVFTLMAVGDAPGYLGRPQEDKGDSVESIFEIRDNPVLGGTDAKGYYIKPIYTTPENLAEGKRVFVEHCAVCHGTEGGGDGPRAAEMRESKPRILTNIHWLHTRDDLRLLRSIKYGVPGTSMVAWGDATTMLQRLQLVIYIRYLSMQMDQRNELAQVLYRGFEEPSQKIEHLRGKFFGTISQLESELARLRAERKLIESQPYVDEKENQAKQETQALELYKKEQELTKQLEGEKSQDQKFILLTQQLEQERVVSEAFGKFLLNSNADKRVWTQFMAILQAQANRYTFKGDKILISPADALDSALTQSRPLFATLLAEKQQQAAQLGGQFATPQRRQELLNLAKEIGRLEQVEQEYLSTLFELKRLQAEQNRQVEQINSETAPLKAYTTQGSTHDA